jgi:hypothetical protein
MRRRRRAYQRELVSLGESISVLGVSAVDGVE